MKVTKSRQPNGKAIGAGPMHIIETPLWRGAALVCSQSRNYKNGSPAFVQVWLTPEELEQIAKHVATR